MHEYRLNPGSSAFASNELYCSLLAKHVWLRSCYQFSCTSLWEWVRGCLSPSSLYPPKCTMIHMDIYVKYKSQQHLKLQCWSLLSMLNLKRYQQGEYSNTCCILKVSNGVLKKTQNAYRSDVSELSGDLAQVSFVWSDCSIMLYKYCIHISVEFFDLDSPGTPKKNMITGSTLWERLTYLWSLWAWIASECGDLFLSQK